MPKPYDGPIIDAHVHLWDLGVARLGWLRPEADERGTLGDLSAIARDYRPVNYLHDTHAQTVIGAVHIEAGWDLDRALEETDWLNRATSGSEIAWRFVAATPLDAPDAVAQLERQAQFSRVTGIRDMVAWDVPPERHFARMVALMDDAHWRAGFSRLEALGFSFDLLMFPTQADEVLALARDFPNQQIIVNHCGSPIDRDANGMRDWATELRRLSEAPNIAMKISDPVAYDRDWTVESLAEVVLRCIDSFGVERCMFGSDFPVAGLYATYDGIFSAFKIITASLTSDEQCRLFHDNTARLYGL